MWRRQNEQPGLATPTAASPVPTAGPGHAWIFTCAECDTSWTVTAWMILHEAAPLICPSCRNLPARPTASRAAAER